MVGPFGLHPNKTMSSRALGLGRSLVKRGHQVSLFMPPWHTPEAQDRRWQLDGVDLCYVALSGGKAAITYRLVRETLAWKPDVVHFFKPKAYSGLVAWWLWQFQRHRLRLIVDSDDWEGWGGWNERAAYSRWQRQFFAWQERWGMSHCHALTVASKALQSIAWSHGIPPERVAYLPNGSGLTEDLTSQTQQTRAQREALGVGERPLLLLYSRLFEFEIDRFVQVLAGIKDQVPDLAILSIGASLFPEEGARLKALLAKASLSSAVIDLGWTEPEKLPALLSSADAGLYLMDDTLLNRTKCPVKLADLIACGVPVVAEAVGQVAEYVVSGHNGWLCRQGDVAGLIKKTVTLLQDEGQQRRMSAQARAHYRTYFSWDVLAERLLRIYEGR